MDIPVWSMLTCKVLLKIAIDFSVTVGTVVAQSLRNELKQILEDLGLADKLRVEQEGP